MKTKQELRTLIKENRERMKKSEAKEKSSQILYHLTSLPAFFRADVIHTYVSSKKNEVDTHDFIKLMLKHKKRIVVPISDMQTKLMKHSEIFSLSELSAGTLGILEPKMYRPVSVADLDVIIVPAIAVDRKGNRLGFGAGFYDRFLHALQLPTIVLAYDHQVVPEVPREEFDVPVNYIVTESEIIQCG